jgi:pilus assembly protein CpaE
MGLFKDTRKAGHALAVPAAPASTPVAVVDANAAFRAARAIELGEDRCMPFPSLEALEERLVAGIGVVVVAGPSLADSAGLDRLREVTNRPEVAAGLLVEALSTDLLQLALRVGVKDVLPADVDPEQLRTAVDRAADTLPENLGGGGTLTSGDPSQSRVVTVFSTKGGAGKSVIAANLAVNLAKRDPSRPVVLVDADLQFGDVAVMLKMAPQRTIVDAVANFEKLDAQFMQELLVRHEPSGLLVLPAPLEPAFADQIGSAQMLRIISLLRTFAAYVVVDTPAYFNDVVLGLLEASDDILLVASMDVPSIKNVKIGLQTMRLLNIPMSKLRLVLNRANSKVKLEVGEVERTLSLKAEALVPSEMTVPLSVNKGLPAVLDAPRSGVARSIDALAELLVGSPQRR